MASVCPVRPVMLRGIPKSKIGRDWASSASVAGGATANPSDIAIDEEEDEEEEEEKEALGRNASIVLPRKAKLLKVWFVASACGGANDAANEDDDGDEDEDEDGDDNAGTSAPLKSSACHSVILLLL